MVQLLLNMVESQLQEQKTIVLETYHRLLKQGYKEEDSKKMIASCLSIVINNTIEKETSFDDEKYAALLTKLPELT